jgi:LacI family gluconate utilization system Gnt-I transcriptional repressor
MDRQPNPTMADVARLAGVSVMTVSRALRDPASVTDSTRSRVTAAAAEISYVQDRAAGALKSGVSNIVTAIVPSLRNSLFAELLQGLADGMSGFGLVLTVGDGRYSAAEEQRVVAEFLSLRPRGLVLHETVHRPETKRMLKRARVPVIEVGDLPRSPVDVAVSFSNEKAAAAMTAHLIEGGRRRIGFLTLPVARSARSKARLLGYRTALESAGLTFEPGLVAEVDCGFEAGAHGLAQLLDRAAIDAVFGAGDVLALGALFEARRRGLAVPGDLAVASFDDHEICRVTEPPLTSLAIPRYEIGRMCAEIIGQRRAAVSGEAPLFTTSASHCGRAPAPARSGECRAADELQIIRILSFVERRRRDVRGTMLHVRSRPWGAHR